MNLFLVPSWYPGPDDPLAGIFTREQADAIAELRPDIRVIVSTWGQGSGRLSPLRPLASWRSLRWFRRQSRDVVRRVGALHEVFNPALSWSPRFPGALRGMLAANRRNFLMARREFGSVDLVHAHVGYPGGFLALQLQAEFGVPYILTEHMGPFPFPSLVRDGAPVAELVSAYRGAARRIAVSPALAADIASYGLGDAVVVPNMVDERTFRPAAPAPGPFVFFALSQLSEEKGTRDLLLAFAAWSPPAGTALLRIGGDGPRRQEYEALSRQLGIDDRVVWIGRIARHDVPSQFGACHAFVLPSHHESFGVVCVEALACGKPVIATRCGGPESIVTGANGMLVEIGNIPQLAEALRRMSETWSTYDPAVLRAGCERRFSRASVVERLATLYREVLQAAPPPAGDAGRLR